LKKQIYYFFSTCKGINVFEWNNMAFKGNGRLFELRRDRRLIPSVMINWSVDDLLNLVLNGHHPKNSIKP
jgi:hypothetical protein